MLPKKRYRDRVPTRIRRLGVSVIRTLRIRVVAGLRVGVVRGLRIRIGSRSELQPVEVADAAAAAAYSIFHQLQDVDAGSGADRLGQRGPGLPATRIGNGQGAGDIGAVEHHMEGTALAARGDADI